MEIVVAKSAGFCFGVKRAVEMAYQNASKEHTFTYGPIIHNEVVIEDLEKKGVYAVDSFDNSTIKHLIIRSHGVGADIYNKSKDLDIDVIDATCPYVKKIHEYVRKYSQEGYQIIIAGNREHPEIIGINGWANNQCLIAKDVEELKQIKLTKDADCCYLLVAQTTYKREVVEEMKAYLSNEGIQFEMINTICNATKERQDEAVVLAQSVDTMIVIGSAKSSNTNKLYEISSSYCKNSFCVQGKTDLNKDMFNHSKRVGITAGASTPQTVIDEVIQYISKL